MPLGLEYLITKWPVPMAARSEERTVFDRRTLGLWVRIPLEAWIYVRVFLCCVVLCR
jgi:hypothetical protein